jgi:RPC5 protein
MHDNVVLELPVVFKSLQNPPYMTGDLSLLQFMNRPADRPYGDQGQLSNVALHSDGRLGLNFSTSADDNVSVITSRVSSLALDGYLVGFIENDSFVLVPLSSVNQLRSALADRIEPVLADIGSLSLTAKQIHLFSLERSYQNSKDHGSACDFYDDESSETQNVFLEHILSKNELLPLRSDFSGYVGLLGELYLSGANGSSEFAKFNLSKQLDLILKKLVCCTFEDIFSCVAPNIKQNTQMSEIVTALEEFAYLVQGYWILKSHHSAHRVGLWPIRDVLLISLRGSKELRTSALAALAGGVAESEAEEVLRPLCIVDQIRGTWKFKYPENSAYISRNPEIFKRQSDALDELMRGVRNRIKSDAGIVADMDSKLHQVLYEFLKQGVKSFEEIRKIIQAQSNLEIVEGNYVQHLINQVGAKQIRAGWFCLIAQGSSYDEHRQVIYDLFRARDYITKQDALDCFSNELQKPLSITDHELRRLLKEFAILKKSQWCFRSLA